MATKYEYKTASYFIRIKPDGDPYWEVDQAITRMEVDRWEFHQLSHTMSDQLQKLAFVILFRREKLK